MDLHISKTKIKCENIMTIISDRESAEWMSTAAAGMITL